MHVITLTTDWNQKDFYLAAIKGKLLGICPDIKIFDLSHDVPPFNTAQAAFIVKNSYRHFPEGSIHIIGVNSKSGKRNRYLAILMDGQYFITYDNGIYGLLFRDEPEEAVEIKPPEQIATSFPELDVFIDAACLLVKKGKLNLLGPVVSDFSKTLPLRATIDKSSISGSIIYIDSYRNAITNITSELFDRIGHGRKFEIMVQSNRYKITRLNKIYGETTTGEILALFNSVGLLEIAINLGNAAELLGLEINSGVRVSFKG